MGGNQISTPAQASCKVNMLPRELVMVLLQNGKMIGTIKTTPEELAEPVVGCYEDKMAKVRSSLRGFHFDWWQQRMQSVNLTPPPLNPLSRIVVKTLTGKEIPICCEYEDIVYQVKTRIQNVEGVPQDQQRLIFNEKELEEWRTLDYYNVENDSVIYLIVRLRGGGDFNLPVDLSKPEVYNGEGVDGGNYWETYGIGLNLQGNCPNASCISKGNEVCVKLGFPKGLILTDSKKVHICPACDEDYITVRTFLVSAARAKIRFRKSFSNEIETLLLEAPSDSYGQYATLLATKEDDQKVAYDYIEITTVGYEMSFHTCQSCNQRIRKAEEKLAPCGRAFHYGCFYSWPRKDSGLCAICDLPEFALSELPRIVALYQDKRVKLGVPSHVFGKCSSRQSGDGEEAKPIGDFLKEVALKQFEILSSSQIPITDLHQSFVANILPWLIQNTEVTPQVVEKLRELKVISTSEEIKINCIQDEVDKARKLYKIIPMRASGISALMAALPLSGMGPERAVNILSDMYDTMLTTYSKNGLLGKTK